MRILGFIITLYFGLVFSQDLSAQHKHQFYVNVSTNPGLQYGFGGFNYEHQVFTKNKIHVNASAGLQAIWGGHYYTGLSYPSIPFGININLGKNRQFLELYGGAVFFWELGLSKEIKAAYKILVLEKFVVKFRVDVAWTKTDDVFASETEEEVFKRLKPDYFLGLSVGQHF